VSDDIARPTRGLKNRNPGNLRANPRVHWQGQVAVDGKDFVVFGDDVDGLRAAIIDLHTHYVRDHETSILALIAAYAPPVENDTKAYAAFVAGRLGVDPLAAITFDRRTATELIGAIVKIEQGVQPYDDVTISAGVESAFLHFEVAA
jgi:hypothetical protein